MLYHTDLWCVIDWRAVVACELLTIAALARITDHLAHEWELWLVWLRAPKNEPLREFDAAKHEKD
jgi:hypothetical protein